MFGDCLKIICICSNCTSNLPKKIQLTNCITNLTKFYPANKHSITFSQVYSCDQPRSQLKKKFYYRQYPYCRLIKNAVILCTICKSCLFLWIFEYCLTVYLSYSKNIPVKLHIKSYFYIVQNRSKQIAGNEIAQLKLFSSYDSFGQNLPCRLTTSIWGLPCYWYNYYRIIFFC